MSILLTCRVPSRAAQFASLAALGGLNEAINSAARDNAQTELILPEHPEDEQYLPD